MVHADPTEDIHLQLVWNTPSDPDQTDVNGTDLDLHFRHPQADDWSGPFNCSWQNPNPDWGEPFDMADDPSLDIDDINGAGPENINLSNPENATVEAPYRVGVHYFRSDLNLGANAEMSAESEVTVRVYLSGELTYSATRRLESSNDLWEVAAIIWTAEEQRVQELDNLSVFVEE